MSQIVHLRRYCFYLLQVFVFGNLSFDSIAEQSVFVHDDFGIGIKSKISVLLGNENVAKGITNDKGLLVFNVPCEQGKQINAIPVSPLYYEEIVDCRPEQSQMLLTVTRKAYASNLEWNASYFQNSGEPGNAALTWSDLAVRLQKVDPSKASIARLKAYTSFAKAIDTPSEIEITGFDKKQNVTVLTPEFVDYLKKYQQNSGLPVTGKIDHATLSTKSNISIWQALYKRY